MGKGEQVLAKLTVYKSFGDPDPRVTVDGDMNYMGQALAVSMIGVSEFADTVIAAVDYYRLERKMTYIELALYIEARVKVIANPDRGTAT